MERWTTSAGRNVLTDDWLHQRRSPTVYGVV